MSNIQDLQAKIEERKQQAREKAQQSLVDARMKLLDDPSYLNTMEAIETSKIKIETLEHAISQCEQVTVEVPIRNNQTREDRKWSGRYNFDFGTDIQLLYNLATGIRYSVREHKEIMLQTTGLDLVTIDQFVEAMGSPAYYSAQYNVVVDSKPYNAHLAKAFATVLGDQLGLVLDTSYLTETNFENSFTKAEARATLLKEESDSAPDSPFLINQ